MKWVKNELASSNYTCREICKNKDFGIHGLKADNYNIANKNPQNVGIQDSISLKNLAVKEKKEKCLLSQGNYKMLTDLKFHIQLGS